MECWRSWSFTYVLFDTDDDDNRNPPSRMGGGVNLSGGYRFQKWETRLNLNLAHVQVAEKKSPDFLAGLSFEPIYHFRRAPKRWDPYIVLPEIGLLSLAKNNAAGLSVALPSVGLQVHLNEKWSLYTSPKVRFGVLARGANRQSGFTVGGEFPLGIIARF